MGNIILPCFFDSQCIWYTSNRPMLLRLQNSHFTCTLMCIFLSYYRQHFAQQSAGIKVTERALLSFESFRTAGATRCTDWGEIWHRGVDRRYTPQCQILLHRCNGVRRFRYMTISVHTLSVHVFSVQSVSVHWMSISVQSLSVHTKYRYSPLRYIKCQFRYKHFRYKSTLILHKLKVFCMLF